MVRPRARRKAAIGRAFEIAEIGALFNVVGG